MGNPILEINTPKRHFFSLRKELLAEISPFHRSDFEHRPGENVYQFSSGDTKIQFHVQGLGDLMIIRQFGRAFDSYLSEHQDPELGKVVIATGAFAPAISPEVGDINCYWWWSFGTMENRPDQYLEQYIEATEVTPDVVLCPSRQTEKEASQLGLTTVRLPLAVGSFRPLGLDRSGLGFAGSKYMRNKEKMNMTVGPFEETIDWVTDFVLPEQLNIWYNSKLATFGTHKEGQRQWGMVNNRVFEAIGSGTPFILESHPTVEEILGFEFPYQTESRRETRELVAQIRERPTDAIDTFEDFSTRIHNNHTYGHRVRSLIDALR